MLLYLPLLMKLHDKCYEHERKSGRFQNRYGLNWIYVIFVKACVVALKNFPAINAGSKVIQLSIRTIII